MNWLYRRLIRPVLFNQDAEQTHERALRLLGWASRRPGVCRGLESFLSGDKLPIRLFGLEFPNPVGLAAGMDKYAEVLPIWKSLGFGFTELGGVTWHPQPGNPRPRIFRAVADEAIINRMGFNNPGAEAMAERLARWRALGRWPSHPVAINLGKSKITPLNEAAEDYARSFGALRPFADFFVVNVSSPNTPGLRQLQDKAALDDVLAAIQSRNTEIKVPKSIAGGGATERDSAKPLQPTTPVLVKVAPDLSFEELDQIVELAGPRQIAGIVATNTTLTRPQTSNSDLQSIYAESGGLSGRPLRSRSTEIIRHLYRSTNGKLPIIGVGGIFIGADAWEKITAGASLIQLYTGLVYEGPGIVHSILSDLAARLEKHSLSEVRQAIGLSAN